MPEERSDSAACRQGSVASETETPTASRKGNRIQMVAVCGLLVLAVGLVFGQTARFDFIVLDDPSDVTLNPHVNEGLKAEEVWWVFTNFHGAAWMPMTSLSHMVACELFGLEPGGHHVTNVVLHAAVAVLLFLLLRQWTGRLWASALVAAVFAIHPLRVESVAWVTERKDVLSGLFFVLTLWAYGRYSRQRFSLLRYSLVLVFFALGLMSKPMLVTMPALLLLLDYWPLGRWTVPPAVALNGEVEGNAARASGKERLWIAARLLLEKVPLVAMVVASSLATVSAHNAEILATLRERYDLAWRLGTVPLSYVSYLGMFFYPVDLAIPYPRPGLELPYGRIAAAVVLLAVLTLVAVLLRRKYPYLFVGWFWFVGMLLPVSGIVQFGIQTKADRFTYLPQIGLCVALAWGLAEVFKSSRWRSPVYAVAAVAILVTLAACAHRQTSYWRDDRTLWSRSLACNPGYWWAHHELGSLEQGEGHLEKAIEYYREAISLKADEPDPHYNLAVALANLKRLDEAIREYEKTLELQPNNAVAKHNLGDTYLLKGDLEKAMAYCREALQLDPDFAEAHYNLSKILFLRGRSDEAVAELQAAVASRPDYQEAQYALGAVLAQRGRFDEAIDAYRMALTPKSPITADVHYALGVALVADNQVEEAAEHFREALKLRPNFPAAQHELEKLSAGRR